MAPPARRAPLGSTAAITEDLRLARDVVGLARADAGRLAATISMLDPSNSHDAVLVLGEARDLLSAQVIRGCRAYAAGRTDAAAVAAALSTREILLQPLDVDEMASTIRRRVLRQQSCNLTIDALRKREGSVLEVIAESTWQELQARRTRSGPQTPEQVVLLMAPKVRRLRGLLVNLLARTYPRENVDVTEEISDLIMDTIFALTEVQWYARTLLVVANRPLTTSPSDMVFVSVATGFVYLPFQSDSDRARLADVFLEHRRGTEDFMEAAEEIEGGRLVERCLAWLFSCYPTCAYERTRNWHLMCEPHLLATFLDLFGEAAGDMVSGELDRTFMEDLGALTIPDFLRQSG